LKISTFAVRLLRGIFLEPHTIRVNSVVFGRAAWLGQAQS